ncbi:MAG: response regulator [Phormidesmis sp. RL_2_1]|nr:response regulator [Phormidesmis sp. RL_2_1]
MSAHNPEETLNILIVDDDEVDRMALRRALKATDFQVSCAEVSDCDSALEALAHVNYDCIFLDYNLPGKNGLELTRHIRSRGIRVPLIALTGQGDEQTAVDLMKAGASDYLPKHKLSAEAIARLVRSALKVHRAEITIDAINRNLRDKNRLLKRQNKELEQQRLYIYQQNLQLQEVSRLKSEFLATMSHELRTPLNAIIGFSQILLSKSKDPITQQQANMLNRVLANGKNLLEIIDDVLIFSKMEAGRLSIKPSRFDISQLVRQTVLELASLASQKSLPITIDDDLKDCIVINDQARIRQILVNLLSNAIKFTQVGTISIRLTALPLALHSSAQALATDNHVADSILLMVSDTGCGISREDQKHIFEPFYQADQKTTRLYGGTGLGLAITYSLVEMMHGTISVSSDLGHGTTFRIVLPRAVMPGEV